MAIQMTYDSRNENAKAYKDYLTKNAAEFSLTPEQIGKIPNPVLVRQVGDDADVNAIINSTEGGARLGSSEQAKVDADKLKQSTLEKFVDNGKGEILNPGNRSFLRAAVQDIKTDTDANTFFTDNGQITQQGAERVRNALFAKAYNDSYILARMSEATDSNSKNVLKAMIAAAPKVAKVNDGIKNGEVYPEYDVSKVITDSVKKLMSLRDANKPLDFYLNENSLFDEENSEENKAMLKFMDGNKFKVWEMAELFNGLADRAFAMGNPAQGNMFGDMERPTMVELIKNTIKDIKGRTGDLDYDQEDAAQGRMEATESTGSGQTHRPETQGMAAEGSTPQNTEGTVVNEGTQTSESGETPQHNDENAEPQQTQAAEGTEASESKQNQDEVKSDVQVNGYGEATHREITSPSYKRAQKRIEQDINSFMSGRANEHWNSYSAGEEGNHEQWLPRLKEEIAKSKLENYHKDDRWGLSNTFDIYVRDLQTDVIKKRLSMDEATEEIREIYQRIVESPWYKQKDKETKRVEIAFNNWNNFKAIQAMLHKDKKKTAEGTQVSESKQNQDEVELAPGYKTSSGKPLSEADKDDFIIKPDGSMDFGYITEEIEKATNGELKKAPIRLKVGVETKSKGSEGLLHAKKHEKDARNVGYNSVEDLIADVTKNFDSIYRKENGINKNPTYTLVKHRVKSNEKNAITPLYLNLVSDGPTYYVVITALPKGEKSLKRQLKKEQLIYSSQGIDATGTPNGTPVSGPANNTVGVGRDGLPTSDKSSVPSTTNVAQGQEEVNGVDNAKLAPYRDAVAQIMSQAGRDKSYLSKAENALMDIIKDANYASQGQFDLMKVVTGTQDQLTHEEMLAAQKIANDALGKIQEVQVKKQKAQRERILKAKAKRENNEKYKKAALNAEYEAPEAEQFVKAIHKVMDLYQNKEIDRERAWELLHSIDGGIQAKNLEGNKALDDYFADSQYLIVESFG